MIGIPQTAARHSLQAPAFEQNTASTAARTEQVPVSGIGIDVAEGADCAVSPIHLVPQVAGICTEAPFVNAPIRAESEAPRRHFEIAPPAKRSLIFAAWKSGAIGDAPCHSSRITHKREWLMGTDLFEQSSESRSVLVASIRLHARIILARGLQ
jgi:hypothetical protein